MKHLLKQLIVDFHAGNVPSPSPRQIQIPKFPSRVRKAVTLIGMRRSGKTWSFYQIIQDLVKQGVPFEKMFYINFEDDRLLNIKTEDLQKLLDAYFEIYPSQASAKDIHFFMDEIHVVPGWEKFVRRILDTEPISLYLSGSSAKMLSKEISTSLRGRTITREIFPFSFREVLDHNKIILSKIPSTKEQAILNHHAQKYLMVGGFPETLDLQPELHREIVQGYLDVVIYRDMIERYHIQNHSAVKHLLLHSIQNSATLISIHKIYLDLKSLGCPVSKDSLYQFMNYFEDAFCLFTVPVYELSLRKRSIKPKKVYAADPGLITALTIKSELDHAARLETAVFNQLRRSGKDIFYYQTREGKEVDFLFQDHHGKRNLFQVSLSLRDPNTAKREVQALQGAMLELGIRESCIVTLDEEKTIKVPEGTVHCLPFWRWGLSNCIDNQE